MERFDNALELRRLPLAVRLVLALFLVSVGFGYFSGLVQLHFQRAASGKLLPGVEENVAAYHGKTGSSQIERLLTADESRPFNGEGSMKPAFFAKSAGWARALKQVQKEKKFDAVQAETALRAERDGERLALLDWIRAGAPRAGYEKDDHLLPAELQDQPITGDVLVRDANDEPVKPRRAKIQSILNDRCVRCHSADKSGAPARFPLDNYDDVLAYSQPSTSGGMSLTRLAQTTHVHLLGFSVLFCLTGLIFSLTSYPAWVRCLFGPLTLLAQLVDISCWWLSRADPQFTHVLMISGGAVAVSLMVQIVGGLWALFSRPGRLVLLLLIVLALGGALHLKGRVIDPYLDLESRAPQVRDGGPSP
jgi:hypothetical protein